MHTTIVLLTLLFASQVLFAQQVLHFTRTSGFDHQTRGVSYAMFQSIADELELEVDDDASGDAFSDANTLAGYSVIVFSNTSGNAILTPAQRTNFEQWIANGGRVLGIHAASDTYRHSTANGNNTGTWDFYAELIGASVQEAPNHVSGTPGYQLEHIEAHSSTANLPDPWLKNEEYYYWENGYFGSANTVVLEVEETIGPNGQVNSYDAPRPMSWYRALPLGNRVFYTALGHAPDNFTSDMLFRQHIKDALSWLLVSSTGITADHHTEELLLTYDPNVERLFYRASPALSGRPLLLLDMAGRVVLETRMNGSTGMVSVAGIAKGNYVLHCQGTIAQHILLH